MRIALGLIFSAVMGVASAQTISTSAKFALLEDFDTGAVLFDKSSEELMPPASMSKLMVAELVFRELKEGRLKLDDKFHVSEFAWRTGGAHAHGSAMFVDVRSDVRVEDLLRGLLIQSGNDAALVLAEGLGGSEENFVGLMNKRAAELGLNYSHFTNAWGRSDPDERVTARDLALLAIHIIRDYPDFYHYFGEKDFTWNKIHQMNRNPLLTMNLGADGLKTGDTAESGFGLVGSAVQDGQRLILVINGLKTAAERAEESRKLLNWGFRAFDLRTFFQPGDTIGRARVYGGADESVELTTDAPIKGFVPKVGTDKLTAKVVYSGPAPAPIDAGSPMGEVRIFRNDSLMLSAPLKTKTAVPVGGLVHRAFDAALLLGEDWLRQGCASALSSRGRFITFEGGEGAGKSAQARRLVGTLAVLGIESVSTREPGGTPHAERLRERILSGALQSLGPAAEAIAFSAARIDHVDALITPTLESGVWVVSDRFIDSTRAYQGIAGHLHPEFIARLEEVAIGERRPDLTLVLDLPPEQGLARAEARRGAANRADRFEGETLDFHKTLRAAFLTIAREEPSRCVVIDAGADETTVGEAIWAAVENRLGAFLPKAPL